MKNQIRNSAMAILLMAAPFISFGQDNTESNEPCKAKWAPENGYWQIISNVNTPKEHKLFFYTDSHICFYKKELKGVRLNIKRRSVKMQLKKELEKELASYMKRTGTLQKETAALSK